MNTTKRFALLSGFVTTSLVAGILAASARTEPPPTRKSSAELSAVVGSVEVGSSDIRLTWLVRPRPEGQGSSTI